MQVISFHPRFYKLLLLQVSESKCKTSIRRIFPFSYKIKGIVKVIYLILAFSTIQTKIKTLTRSPFIKVFYLNPKDFSTKEFLIFVSPKDHVCTLKKRLCMPRINTKRTLIVWISMHRWSKHWRVGGAPLTED